MHQFKKTWRFKTLAHNYASRMFPLSITSTLDSAYMQLAMDSYDDGVSGYADRVTNAFVTRGVLCADEADALPFGTVTSWNGLPEEHYTKTADGWDTPAWPNDELPSSHLSYPRIINHLPDDADTVALFAALGAPAIDDKPLPRLSWI